MIKNPPAMWETWILSLGWEDPLEEGMATHSSILENPHGQRSLAGRPQSMGWQELDMTERLSTQHTPSPINKFQVIQSLIVPAF